VVFSCRAAIDTIDAPALASHTTLVVDHLSTTSRGSSCIRPGTLSSLKQTSSSSLVPCVTAVALLLCLPHQQSIATGSLFVGLLLSYQCCSSTLIFLKSLLIDLCHFCSRCLMQSTASHGSFLSLYHSMVVGSHFSISLAMGVAPQHRSI
jgi:hypothetical protein